MSLTDRLAAARANAPEGAPIGWSYGYEDSADNESTGAPASDIDPSLQAKFDAFDRFQASQDAEDTPDSYAPESQGGMTPAQLEALNDFTAESAVDRLARQERMEELKQTALDLGKVGVVFAIGVGNIGFDTANKRLLKGQFERSKKKHAKQEAKAERKADKRQAKQERIADRKQARADMRDKLNEKTIGRARKFGKNVMKSADFVYQTGLEKTDAVKAEARKSEQRESERKSRINERIYRTNEAVANVDTSIQSEKTKELFSSWNFSPFDTVEGQSETGFMSGAFTSESEPDKKFAIYYKQLEGGQLFPQLMVHDKKDGWKKDSKLWKEGYSESDSIDKDLLRAANSQLDPRIMHTPRLTEAQFQKFKADYLDFSAQEAPVSEFRKKREALIEAKKRTAASAPKPATQPFKVTDNRTFKREGAFPSKNAA